MQAIRDFFRTFFNMTVSRRWRLFMLAWTGFFTGYELAMMFLSDSPLFHFAFLIFQATFFVAYVRAKTF